MWNINILFKVKVTTEYFRQHVLESEKRGSTILIIK